MDSSLFFTQARQHASPLKQQPRDYSLYLDDLVTEGKKKQAEEGGTTLSVQSERTPPFNILNPAYENQRSQADPDWKTMNEERKKDVLRDPYIAVAYHLIAPLIK
jgi:hypothetical protein